MSQKTAEADPNKIVVTGRLSFPNLFKPRQNKNEDGEPVGVPKYSAAILLDKEKDAEVIKAVQKIIKRICVETWKNKTISLPTGQKIVTGPEGAGKVVLKGIALRDGTEKDDKEGYGDDVMFISTSSLRPPHVVIKDEDGNLVKLNAEDGKPYAGCFGKFSIRFWPQDNKHGKRVNAELRAFCFTEDGDSFGAGPVNVEEDFADDEDAPVAKKKAAADDEW